MLTQFLETFRRNEDGQDLVEYSLLLAFIAMTVIAVLTTVSGSIRNVWTSVDSKLTSAAS